MPYKINCLIGIPQMAVTRDFDQTGASRVLSENICNTVISSGRCVAAYTIRVVYNDTRKSPQNLLHNNNFLNKPQQYKKKDLKNKPASTGKSYLYKDNFHRNPCNKIYTVSTKRKYALASKASTQSQGD